MLVHYNIIRPAVIISENATYTRLIFFLFSSQKRKKNIFNVFLKACSKQKYAIIRLKCVTVG